MYPAVLLEGRFPAAQENGKCAVSTAAAWQLWGSEDVLGQELEIEGDIYRVCGLFRSSASLALCGESLDHGFSNIEFWGGYAAPPKRSLHFPLHTCSLASNCFPDGADASSEKPGLVATAARRKSLPNRVFLRPVILKDTGRC